jgi:hypothetical protein
LSTVCEPSGEMTLSYLLPTSICRPQGWVSR